MTKNTEITLKTISALLIIGFITTAGYYSYRFLRCFSDAKNITYHDSFDVLHITMYGSSGDTVSGKFTLYDTSGREVAELERSWNAQALYLQCVAACFDDREFLFPYKIYGDENGSMTSGTNLRSYYMEHGECLLLSRYESAKERRALYHLGVFAFAKSVSYMSKFSKVYTIDLSSCIPGNEYMLVISQKGNLFLQPVGN